MGSWKVEHVRSWEDLDGPFFDTLEAVTRGPNRLDLLAIGGGRVLHHKCKGVEWMGRYWLNLVLSSPLVDQKLFPGVRISQISKSADRAIHYKWYDGCDKWEPTTYDGRLGGRAVGEQVTAPSPAKDRIDIFYVRADAWQSLDGLSLAKVTSCSRIRGAWTFWSMGPYYGFAV